jgi:hypothetical protein
MPEVTIQPAPTDGAATVTVTPSEDEEYKWLTDRLDAIDQRLSTLTAQFGTALDTMRDQQSNQSSELRTMLQATTEMLTTAQNSLTALAASVTLNLTRPNTNAIPSQQNPPEPTAETVTVLEPAAVAQTLDNRAANAPASVSRRRSL